jgi:FlaG/FlaF family flagellin (archaellin)
MRFLKLFILFSIVLSGCKTEEPENPPKVITKVASDVTLKNATLNGEVTNEGFSATTDRGFVFSEKNTNPSVSDLKVQSGYGKGVYSIVLDKLPVNTKYYYKAYATNTKGTAYGDVQSFTTADYNLANISTDVPKSIGYTTVNLGGVVLGDGGGNVTERGFVVGENPTPTVLDLKFSDLLGGLGAYTFFISSLKVSTKYYVRAYAINEKGISYGNTYNFTTADLELPSVITDKPILVMSNSVRIGGAVTNDGGSNIKERGICYSLQPNPTVSNFKIISGLDLGTFEVDIRDLQSNTTYYYRAYAINSKGIAYGIEQSFKTW